VKYRFPAAATIAIVALVMTVGPALGAIDGSVDPSSARPGDWIELTTTTGACCPAAYASIAQAGPTPLFLQLADPSSAGNLCSNRVGALTWKDGVGQARFQVPAVQPGEYWFLVTVQGGCWRFGNGAGILTLTILAAGDPSSPSVPLVLAVGIGLAAVVGTVLIGLRRRSPTTA
jgi:hypothetical protein